MFFDDAPNDLLKIFTFYFSKISCFYSFFPYKIFLRNWLNWGWGVLPPLKFPFACTLRMSDIHCFFSVFWQTPLHFTTPFAISAHVCFCLFLPSFFIFPVLFQGWRHLWFFHWVAKIRFQPDRDGWIRAAARSNQRNSLRGKCANRKFGSFTKQNRCSTGPQCGRVSAVFSKARCMSNSNF